MRRSKSLGRPDPKMFLSGISSSSNDEEGISRAYFQRLQRREYPSTEFAIRGGSQPVSRTRRHLKVPISASEFNPDCEPEEDILRQKLRVSYKPIIKYQISQLMYVEFRTYATMCLTAL